MEFIPAGSHPSRKGPAEYFTGSVRIDLLTESHPPASTFAARVTFEPGARTAWHTHPLGQLLHVLSGRGLFAERDAPPRILRPGDSVWIEPGVAHWHGAGPDTAMEHIAIQEVVDGSGADWMEHVSDADYAKAPE